jgi:hypothetical protein
MGGLKPNLNQQTSIIQIWISITGFLALAAHCKTRTYFNTMTAGGTAAVIFGFILLTLAGIANRRAAYAEFLQDCTQDHKQYECMLMWRASDRSRRDTDSVDQPPSSGPCRILVEHDGGRY